MTKQFKIGIVGLGYRLGHVGTLFAKYHHTVKIVAYADVTDTPPGYKILQDAGIDAGKYYPTLKHMLDTQDLDLLAIGSPNFQHLDDIKLGLQYGVQMLCEKPVVTTEQQSWELAEYLQQYGTRQVFVGLVLRYSPHMQDVMDMINSGKIGDITGIEGSEHICPSHGAFFMRDWRRKDIYAGGFMLEKCCHDLDLYNMITKSRPIKVASFGGRKSFVPKNAPDHSFKGDVYVKKPSGWLGIHSAFNTETEIVDYQTALLQYKNGATLAFHTNANIHDEHRRFLIAGTKATIEGDFMRGFVKAFDARTGEKIFDKNYNHTGTKTSSMVHGHYGSDHMMVADVFKNIVDGTEPKVSVQDALVAGLVALKIDEARKTGQMLDLTDTWKKFDSYGLQNTYEL